MKSMGQIYSTIQAVLIPKTWVRELGSKEREKRGEKRKETRNAWPKVIYISFFRPLFIHIHEEWKSLSATAA